MNCRNRQHHSSLLLLSCRDQPRSYMAFCIKYGPYISRCNKHGLLSSTSPKESLLKLATCCSHGSLSTLSYTFHKCCLKCKKHTKWLHFCYVIMQRKQKHSQHIKSLLSAAFFCTFLKNTKTLKVVQNKKFKPGFRKKN